MSEKNLKLPNLNSCQIAGYATSEATLRYTTGGTAVANFSVGYNRRYLGGDGEWKSDSSFIPCVAWKDTATRAQEQIHRGTALLVEGRLQSRSWEQDDGKTRTVLEIVVYRLQVLERPEASDGADEGTDAPAQGLGVSANVDDVPF